ncbi:MAG: hypothetical protein FIA93_12230 [Deltaproteobacteria bacterium]|nr:hypothetical protein [Deltaproteobacteria bacterium]PWB64139.1 MAG: hypothetical protein C3F14_07195 [Deltaproteobacteria bacterium]
MASRHPVLLAALLIAAFSPQALHAKGNPVFSDYEYQVTDDGAFGLYKPRGWKVDTRRSPKGKTILVSDRKGLSRVEMTFLDAIGPGLDSVTLASDTLKDVKKRMADLKVVEARSDRGRTHTVVKTVRRGPGKTPLEGRYCFNVKRPAAVAFAYEAPAKTFRETVPNLLTVISNISLLEEQVYRQRASRAKGPKPAELPMKRTPAPDGTCSLLVPEGWKFTAGKGAALCSSPDGDTGYLFSVIGFVGPSRIPYFDSSSIPGDLRYGYMPPADALVVAMRHFGSSNHRVLERHPNPSWAGQAAGLMQRKSDAEIAVISYTSKNGVPCVGYFEILGLHPTSAGQWGIIPMGIWAPSSRFAQSLPSLVKISESYRMNEKWASEYIRQGMANLKAMMKKTSSMMSRYSEEMRQSSLAAHQERMKSGDFISYKFSTYMRGEQEWVTGLEGGKIYTTDHWGLSSGGKLLIEGPPFNYYNYQGDAKFGDIPVDSSREVYEAVKGIR